MVMLAGVVMAEDGKLVCQLDEALHVNLVRAGRINPDQSKIRYALG